MKIKSLKLHTLEFKLVIKNTLGIVTLIIEATGKLWEGINENIKLAFAVTIGLSDVTDVKVMFPALGW